MSLLLSLSLSQAGFPLPLFPLLLLPLLLFFLYVTIFSFFLLPVSYFACSTVPLYSSSSSSSTTSPLCCLHCCSWRGRRPSIPISAEATSYPIINPKSVYFGSGLTYPTLASSTSPSPKTHPPTHSPTHNTQSWTPPYRTQGYLHCQGVVVYMFDTHEALEVYGVCLDNSYTHVLKLFVSINSFY